MAGRPLAVASAGSRSVWVMLASGDVVAVDNTTGATRDRVALSASATALAAVGDGLVVATADGRLHLVDRPGGSGRVIASPGASVDSLATARGLIFGTAQSTALLYATEVAE
jgi:hypothetical protein